MEGRGTVEEDRVVLYHLVQSVPDLRGLALDHLLRALDRRDDPLLLQPLIDERFEQLDGHLLRQAALVELELRPHDDDAAAGVIHPLAQEVLSEAALLALEHVREALEGPLVRTTDDPAPPSVVEQGVHRLLEHPFFVADDDLRGFELLEPDEAVVPVNHAAVEVVEVARGKAAAV